MDAFPVMLMRTAAEEELLVDSDLLRIQGSISVRGVFAEKRGG